MTTLINTTQGVIAVVEQPCCEGDWGWNVIQNRISTPEDIEGYYFDLNLIIASTFGVGKKLELPILDTEETTWTIIDLSKPYEYTETETSIIVKL